ncbi:DNA double-strand break repair nuclease NurA [Microvirga terricola]|uniref:DNA double-strand break repair nuclease NurA n=1 Tax=Microvirga terricola TaxID=2719797 RepID=A0ABX0V7T7_9HYPH|nr:DNA double-strand break repair nuclease NurA [Microvirga terricola]
MAFEDTLPEEEVQHRIETRVSLGHFMANILRAAGAEKADVQQSFAKHLCDTAKLLDGFLRSDGRIARMDYLPGKYWPAQRGRRFAFIDGGVANVALPGAAPLAIRVGAYLVRPGREGADREDFAVQMHFVDDLYDPAQDVYDNDFEDIAKLRDAARIIAEAGACRSLFEEAGDIDALLIQGPLINPVSPYGTPGFPAYTASASEKLCRQAGLSDRDRHFIPLYLRILRDLRDRGSIVAGVVERDGGGRRFIKNVLDQMVERGKLDNARRTRAENFLKKYSLSDTQLLDLILREGEYVLPLAINRQGGPDEQNKWPKKWENEIGQFPLALTTFLKPSENVQPLRVETFEGTASDDLLSLVLHTSRLLPRYGFPVGLDVVDRFAKVPDWMGRQIATGHKVNLLRKAFATDNEKVRDFSIRMLSASGRDWLYRPKI